MKLLENISNFHQSLSNFLHSFGLFHQPIKSKKTALVGSAINRILLLVIAYFKRILFRHKSYLVNVNEIIKYVKGKGGSLILTNGKEIIVSPSKKAQLLSYFK